MPLTVNIGLSRKSSRNYQSTGASINLTAELDQALLARPAELQAAVDRLYEQAAELLDRRLGPSSPDLAHAGGTSNGVSNGYAGHSDERIADDPAARRAGRGVRPATASQRRLLSELTHSLGLDLEQLAGERCATTPRELTVRQASRLIDHLRATERAG